MALNGTVAVTTTGFQVAFSTDENFRARALYVYNLTAGNSVLIDISTTQGASTGFPVLPTSALSFPELAGITGFSVIASTASGSALLSYLASR